MPAQHHCRIAAALERVERDELDRLMIFMPPRHGKSELASRRFPARYLGLHPGRQIIAASYNSDLATDFGRDVRNLMASPEYGDVFPGVGLRVDSKAADRMNTNRGGVYIAAGVGTATTGRGAHLGLIDDPFKDRQDADSEMQRERVWNWYRSTFFTRLMPGGAIVLIQCMTGDTPVLMEDGSETPLRDIRPGDRVATYEDGALSASTVRNWANQGPDLVYEIRMKSGTVVRANARHPFLVIEGGKTRWARTDSLRRGSQILRVTGANGGASPAPSPDAKAKHLPEGYAESTTAGFGIFEGDEVVSITDGGFEDVFDIQVDRTENFIANGLVSHNTRWHEDDLAGRLLEQDGRKEEGGEWEVLELPAIDGAGCALWPEWYDVPALERIKRTIGPREWSALYMQQPQPDEGGFFKREWFKFWTEKPKRLRIYGTSDYAVTDGGGDYTVHRVWGVDAEGDLYRLDGWRGQTTADVWIDRKLDLIQQWKPLAWFGESGVIQKAVEPMLTRRMRERRVFCRLEWLPSIADKPTRARGIQARLAMGKVWFEQECELGEFLHFPAGKHDDDVDTASLIGRALDEAHPAVVVTAISDRNPHDPPDLRSRRDTSDSWKVA